jgi:hypothetical protein
VVFCPPVVPARSAGVSGTCQRVSITALLVKPLKCVEPILCIGLNMWSADASAHWLGVAPLPNFEMHISKWHLQVVGG